MVFTAYLICIAGLLGSLGHCDNSCVCKAQARQREAPQAHVWKGRGGRFRPFTFCKSVDSSCFADSCSSVKTLLMVGAMQCTIKGGTASLARSSGGTGVPRMGSAEASSMIISEDNWAQLAEWSEALDTYDQTEAARTERRLNLLRRNGARLLRSFLESLILGDDIGRDFDESEQRVADRILARFIHGAAHLPRLELGRRYARILPDVQRRQWLGLLERYDQGGDADSTSGSSSSDSAAGEL